MVMGAVVCGITELADMMVYFEKKLDFYKEKFGIEKYPSKPTLSRILNLVDGDAVGKVVVQIMRDYAGELGSIIAVDGKAIGGTGRKDKAHSFLQVLTAYATESGVTLAQESISYEDKTNEIPVFQSMLDYLDVAGKTITADAMHCQKETCEKIVGKHGDYVFGLKGNQGRLYEDVTLYFSDSINNEDVKTFKTFEKNGGRFEKRICFASDDVSWIPDLPSWAGLKTIFAITRITTVNGKITEDTCFYITSLPCNPEKLLSATRSHWKIESLHWSLDVIWNEDDSGILSDNGHKTLNAFRKLAYLGHKNFIPTLPRKRSVKGNVLAALLDDDVCFGVLRCL
jgi:predicted transposase YbfD/YdcC